METSSFEMIQKEVKSLLDKMTAYSEEAKFGPFIEFYFGDPSFFHISADGKMRNHDEFRKICSAYYDNLSYQKIVTISQKINVPDRSIVISGWTGNITAFFKNGDSMVMNNYSVSNVFMKVNDNWKIIQSHESSLPPEIIKKD